MYMYSKRHNSGLNNYCVMPLFRLGNLCKNYNHGHNSKRVQYIQMKLGTHVATYLMHIYSKGILLALIIIELCPFFTMKVGTLFPKDNVHIYTKWHHTRLNNYCVVPILEICA